MPPASRHGGKRKGAGRKPRPYLSRLLRVSVKDEAEYRRLLEQIPDPRKRVEILLGREAPTPSEMPL